MIFHCFLVVRALGARARHGAKHSFAHAAGHARRTTGHAAISAPTHAVATKVCVAVGLAALGAAGPVADGATLLSNPPMESSRQPTPPVGVGPGWAVGSPDRAFELGPDRAGRWADPPISFDPAWAGGFPDPAIPIDPEDPPDDPTHPAVVAEPSSISILALGVLVGAALSIRMRRAIRVLETACA